MSFPIFLRILFVICAVFILSSKAYSVERGTDFSQNYDLVYQIRVIAEKAGSKSSIGSGFQISKSGLIVTNYHVISSYVQYPDKNKITYESHTGETGELALIEFDVINDLAILQHPKPAAKYLQLSETPLNKGDTIFSLGNPGDYGIKLVKGPNNGLADHNYKEVILFSASLNGGMSGGPALNESGDVVGVNVSTAGGQLSFLVPVSKVVDLIAEITPVENDAYQDDLARQIKTWQRPRIGELIDSGWPVETFVDKELFGQIRFDFKCWGSTNEDDNERRIHTVHKSCRTGNVVYLASDLNTGNIYFSLQETTSLKLNEMQFSETINTNMNGANKSNFDNSSNFQCSSDFLELKTLGDEYGLISTCIRRYKKLSGLYDSLMEVDIVKGLSTFTGYISIYGVEKDQIQSLNRKFIEAVL